MFGRPPRHESDDVAGAASPRTAFERPLTPQQLAAARLVIGPSVRIVGTNLSIMTEGTVQIDGEFTGDIRAKEVIVGDSGVVKGSICAEEIRVHGHVSGALHGEVVSLQPGSTVTGKILYNSLTLNTGARFEGGVRRSDNPMAATVKADGDTIIELAAYKDGMQRPKLETAEPVVQ